MPLKKLYRPYFLSDVHSASAKRKFTVVSTFAGGGGSSIGYKLAGGHVIFANEFVREAVSTYRENFPKTFVSPEDIRKLSRNPELLKKFKVKKFDLDIFDGSPPCATHSKAAGRSADFFRPKSKFVPYSTTVQKNIEGLIFDFVDMALLFQPKVCVIENVTGIRNSREFAKAMDRLCRVSDTNRGYVFESRELNSEDFGVPQSRKRLFVVAVRNDVAERLELLRKIGWDSVFPKPTSTHLSLRDGFRGLKIDEVEAGKLRQKMLKVSAYSVVKALPFSPKKPTTISDVDPNWTSDWSYIRSSWEKPCRTITQTGAQGGHGGGCIHPDENRVFTLGELKRIFGLPDDYKLPGIRFEPKAERIGRMVAPLVMKELASSIYSNVLAPFNRKQSMRSRLLTK
jgi:DNA (cytosine-5)-methyltransferase 1